MDLLDAINKNDIDKIKEILIDNPSLIDGESFFAAGKVGDINVIRYLVEYSRISLNEYDSEHRNILHYAAMSNRADTFEYLVCKCGMSPFEGDINLVTPWKLAIDSESEDIIKWLQDKYHHSYDDYYQNPIRRGMFPDPSICRVGGDYYMVNSSFIFFPCIPISHSTDLINWEIIGYAITNPEWAHLDELEGGRGFWAPDISYYKGRFYITATYRLNDVPPTYRRQIVVSSDKPEGPYSEPAFIDEDGIDPSIFNDDDGRRYMLLNRGARILELDETATRQISEAKLLYYGDMKRAPEGPHLYKKDGYYYLLLAEGGTGIGHRVTISRSKTLMGDYEPSPYNPIMIQRDDNAAIRRCGHGDLVETLDGRWYMVYLCGRMVDNKWSILGRETAIDPVEWTSDGWPVVNSGDGPSAMQLKPYADINSNISNSDTNTNYNSQEIRLSLAGLPMDYMTPRPFEDGAVKVTGSDKKSLKLDIRGSRAPLSSVDSRNIVLKRQTDFECSFEAALTLKNLYAMNGGINKDAIREGQSAGIIGYYDENTWISFGVICQKDNDSGACNLYMYVQEHIGLDDILKISGEPITIEDYRNPNGDFSISLKMEISYLKRDFYYKKIEENTDAYVLFDHKDNVYYLCDEAVKMGKRFTGALMGMYAYQGDTDKEFRVLFSKIN